MMCDATLKQWTEGPQIITHCARTSPHSGQIEQPHQARRNGRLIEWWQEPATGTWPERQCWRRGRVGE